MPFKNQPGGGAIITHAFRAQKANVQVCGKRNALPTSFATPTRTIGRPTPLRGSVKCAGCLDTSTCARDIGANSKFESAAPAPNCIHLRALVSPDIAITYICPNRPLNNMRVQSSSRQASKTRQKRCSRFKTGCANKRTPHTLLRLTDREPAINIDFVKGRYILAQDPRESVHNRRQAR